MSTPTFAIVGHPNKGKSSLVATLARDASIRIGPEPGTTVYARDFPMRVRAKVLYTLVDTPGFQRARAALDWMKQHETDAGSRAGVVERIKKLPRSVMETANNNGDVFVSLRSVIAAMKEA